jgi:glycosyltransferase involved in cell wall biosynthesis
MKKKIFLIVSSLGAGGSERVYWLLSQYFNKSEYAVSVVFLNAGEQCFSTQINGIDFIDLKTIKASRSFFKLLKLIRNARPHAVFSTTDHINILTAMVACFIKVPHLIARASNNPDQMKQFYGYKARFYNLFTSFFSDRFNFIVCQSEEMRQSFAKQYRVDPTKLKVIPNPVLLTKAVKKCTLATYPKKLVAVGRLSQEKGMFRLLESMRQLPANYLLNIIGDGPLMGELMVRVAQNELGDRVKLSGQVSDVSTQIAQHDLLVLTSFTEGFPNVILEALSVGVPVVTFRVGGADVLIREAFNGFIVEQGDFANLKKQIIYSCNHPWQHEAIKADALCRFSLDNVGLMYENLLNK